MVACLDDRQIVFGSSRMSGTSDEREPMIRQLVAATAFSGLLFAVVGCSDSDETLAVSTSSEVSTVDSPTVTSPTPPSSDTPERTATSTAEAVSDDELPGSAKEICVGVKPMFDLGRGMDGYDAAQAYDEFLADMKSDAQASSEFDAMTPDEQRRFLTGVKMATEGDC